MINILDLREILFQMLNDNESGFAFRIFGGVGKYEEGVRQDTNEVYKFIDVIVNENTNDITMLKNGKMMQSIGISISYLVPMLDNDNPVVQKELQEDEHGNMVEVETQSEWGNDEMIAELESIFVDKFGGAFHFEWGDLQHFTGMALFNTPMLGDRDLLPAVGWSTIYTQSAFFYLVEDGVNERNLNYYLDGDLIPFDSLTDYNDPTMNGYVDKDGKGQVENTELQFQKTWSFVFPLSYDNLGKHCIEHIEGDEKPNTAHIFKIVVWMGWDSYGKPIPKKTWFHLVLCGQTSLQAQATKNASVSLSLVKCTKDFDLLSFPSGYVLYDLSSQATYSVASNVANANVYAWDKDNNTFIDFGDGNAHDVGGLVIVATKKVTGINVSYIIKEY